MPFFSKWFRSRISPEKAAAEALEALKRDLGADLISVVLYGSAASGDANKASDVNLLVVARRLDAPTLSKLTSATKGWSKKGLLKPMFFGARELKASADVFQVEFLDIQDTRKVLHGDDPFKRMSVDRRNLRHQVEYEIKSKLIHFRQRYLAGEGSGAKLKALIGGVLAALMPTARALLRLKRNRPARQRVRVIEDLCRYYRLNRRVLLQAHDLHYRGKDLGGAELQQLFERLLEELEKLGSAVDQMEAPRGDDREERDDRGDRGDRSDRGGRGGRGRGDRDRNGRGRGRNGAGSTNGAPPKKETIQAVKNLLAEIPNRKRWEPKETERFQSDAVSRDQGAPVDLRFGWDRDWLRFKAGKGEAPTLEQAAAADKARAEEEKQREAVEAEDRAEEAREIEAMPEEKISVGKPDAAVPGEESPAQEESAPEEMVQAPAQEKAESKTPEALPEEKISAKAPGNHLPPLDEKSRTIREDKDGDKGRGRRGGRGRGNRGRDQNRDRDRAPRSEQGQDKAAEAPKVSQPVTPPADRLPEEKFYR